MRKVVLDVDTGVDDALAIILAVRSPELKVEAVTTVAGNVPVEHATRNTRLVLDVLQAPHALRVAQGAEQPLRRPLVTATAVHGQDGLGNVTGIYPAPRHPLASACAEDLLLELIAVYGPELTLISTGPMTNLARAAEKNPKPFARVGEVIQMGGAIEVPGNTSPVAEFNIYVDPEAATRVVAAGVRLRLVPLDVTRKTVLLRSEVRRLALERDSSVFQLVREVTVVYFDCQQSKGGPDGGYLHDPAAVAAAIDPGLFTWRPVRLTVKRDEAERGRTVAELWRDSPIQVAGAVDAERLLGLFTERVCR